MNRHPRRSILANEPETAANWMKAQLMMAVRDLEAKFAGTNVTVIVSAPGCGEIEGKPPFSHATSAQPDDLRAVLRTLSMEMVQ